MASLKGLFLAGLGIAILAVSLVLNFGTSGVSQAPPPDELPPGPIRGGRAVPVAVVNTVDVAITGVPAVQIDNPNIKNALPTLDVREAARKPFAFWEEFKLDGAMAGYQQIGPRHTTGKDWVLLNYANVVACAQPREKLSLRLWINYDYTKQGLGAGSRAIQLLLTEQGVFLEPEGAYLHLAGSQPMNLYIQPGMEFWFEVWRSGEGDMHEVRGHAEGSYWLSGYFVPAVQFEGVGTSPGIVR